MLLRSNKQKGITESNQGDPKPKGIPRKEDITLEGAIDKRQPGSSIMEGQQEATDTAETLRRTAEAEPSIETMLRQLMDMNRDVMKQMMKITYINSKFNQLQNEFKESVNVNSRYKVVIENQASEASREIAKNSQKKEKIPPSVTEMLGQIAFTRGKSDLIDLKFDGDLIRTQEGRYHTNSYQENGNTIREGKGNKNPKRIEKEIVKKDADYRGHKQPIKNDKEIGEGSKEARRNNPITIIESEEDEDSSDSYMDVSYDDTPRMFIEIGAYKINALVDTGAQLSIVASRLIEELEAEGLILKKLPFQATRVRGAFGGSTKTVKAMVQIPFRTANKDVTHQFLVVKELAEDLVIGIDFLKDQDAIINIKDGGVILKDTPTPEEKPMKVYKNQELEIQKKTKTDKILQTTDPVAQQVEEVIDKYDEIFETKIGYTKDYTPEILASDQKSYQKPDPKLNMELRVMLKKMSDRQIAREMEKHTTSKRRTRGITMFYGIEQDKEIAMQMEDWPNFINKNLPAKVKKRNAYFHKKLKLGITVKRMNPRWRAEKSKKCKLTKERTKEKEK